MWPNISQTSTPCPTQYSGWAAWVTFWPRDRPAVFLIDVSCVRFIIHSSVTTVSLSWLVVPSFQRWSRLKYKSANHRKKNHIPLKHPLFGLAATHKTPTLQTKCNKTSEARSALDYRSSVVVGKVRICLLRKRFTRTVPCCVITRLNFSRAEPFRVRFGKFCGQKVFRWAILDLTAERKQTHPAVSGSSHQAGHHLRGGATFAANHPEVRNLSLCIYLTKYWSGEWIDCVLSTSPRYLSYQYGRVIWVR